jgi:hypothetical protein
MTFTRSCLLCLAFLALAISPAHAAINKEGAAKLKTVVTNFITEQKKLTELNGYSTVTFQGDTTVEEAGDYYAVTLPYTKIAYDNGDQADIGMISINASEGDAPGQWKMRVAVPTPIIVTDKVGKEVTRITLGGQRAAGIWDESLKSFIKLDAQYKDIVITGIDGTLKIPQTDIVYDFTKDAANKWSGPGSVTFKNIEMAYKNNAGTMKAGELKVDFSVDQYDSNAINQYREKLAALSETIKKDGPNAKPSQAYTSAIANAMADFIMAAGNGMKINYQVTGLSIARAAMPGLEAQTIEIPKGFFGLDLNGFNKGSVHFGVKAGYDGLLITPMPEGGLTPSEMNLDIALEKVPVKDLVDLGKNTMDGMVQNPQLGQMALALLPGKFIALMGQSGSVLNITDTHIGNADIDMRMEGTANADTSAVAGGTANIKLSVRGLDTLISRLKDSAKQPKADIARINDTVQKLETFRNVAVVENGVHVVNLAVTPQGQTTLNGKDLMTALQGSEPKNAAPAPVPDVKKAP